MPIKALMFDVDGTILDTEKIYLKYWKMAAKESGYHIDDNFFLKLRSCDSSIAKNLLFEETNDSEAYNKIRMLRKEMMASGDDPILYKDGVLDAFIHYKDVLSHYRKVIVTSAKTSQKMDILANSGLLEMFDDVISTSEVKRGKPFPDVYLYACEKIGYRPSECLAIEDSPNGVESAFNAGLRVIMIPDLSKANKELRKMSHVVKNMNCAFELIEKL